ncbi:hypothetical protein [Carboxylicivirga sp. N1Y90]|uniref:hypothetical protein n=1 Tax=Carboxylicivirga fragile TaxID=3417571 RepID=UPI003D358427|nr:hypothetical protein [Marinilabiliaceae bacterium N1Y90]
MKIKSTVLLMILVFGSFFNNGIIGQHTGGLPALFDEYDKLQIIEGETEEQYEGSPYLTNDQYDHQLTFDDQIYTDLHLRFNIYSEDMEIEIDEKYRVIPKNKLFTHFSIGNHDFLYIDNFKNKKQKRCYLERLATTDHISFYKKHRINLIKAKSPEPYQEAKKAKFVSISPIYFISIDNNTLQSFTSKKDLLDLFPNIKPEIKSYIKKNKVKFNNEDDLIETLAFTDTLLN